jgi:hypothetical protein
MLKKEVFITIYIILRTRPFTSNGTTFWMDDSYSLFYWSSIQIDRYTIYWYLIQVEWAVRNRNSIGWTRKKTPLETTGMLLFSVIFCKSHFMLKKEVFITIYIILRTRPFTSNGTTFWMDDSYSFQIYIHYMKVRRLSWKLLECCFFL